MIGSLVKVLTKLSYEDTFMLKNHSYQDWHCGTVGKAVTCDSTIASEH